MKRLAIVAALAALVGCGAPEADIPSPDELAASPELAEEIIERIAADEIGTAEQAISVPGKFGWATFGWGHGMCNLSASYIACYVPESTDRAHINWDGIDTTSGARTAVYDAWSHTAIGSAWHPKELHTLSLTPVGEPADPYYGEDDLTYIEVVEVSEEIPVGPTGGLDMGEATHVACLDHDYIGRYNGTGPYFYRCNYFRIEIDVTNLDQWRSQSGSFATLYQVLYAAAKNAYGAALGQPSQYLPNEPATDDNAMEGIQWPSSTLTTFNHCQKGRGQVYDPTGSGVWPAPFGCLL